MLVFTNANVIHLLRLSKMQALLPVKKVTEKKFFDLVPFAKKLCKKAKCDLRQKLDGYEIVSECSSVDCYFDLVTLLEKPRNQGFCYTCM